MLSKPWMRLLRAISLVALSSSILIVSACGSNWPRLASPGMHAVRLGVPYVKPGRPVSVGEMTVCLTRPGEITITDVKPVDPVGTVDVEAFAVRPNPVTRGGQFLGGDQGPLSKHGFSDSHQVAGACKANDGSTSYELGLQLTKPTSADVGVAGWDVVYRSRGHNGTLRLPFAIALCSGVAWERSCAKIHPMS